MLYPDPIGKGGGGMRRVIFYLLTAVLASLVIARSALPSAESVAASAFDPAAYQILRPDPPDVEETAGAGLIGELNSYYFSRVPTAKNDMTGRLTGRSLLIICADGWAPAWDDDSSRLLTRLRTEGVRFSRVFRPDWYQDADGREFALMTGLTPTRLDDMTALARVGEGDIFLPFTLARVLGGAERETIAVLTDGSRAPFYEAIGFSRVSICAGDSAAAAEAAGAIPSGRPFLALLMLSGNDCGKTLDRLLTALEARDDWERDTVICLLTGNPQGERTAQLFLWAGGDLTGLICDAPCTELDITPTLLNLFGAAWDSRFLAGRDLFAGAGDTPGAAPLAVLYGSAYSDWVTERGSYIAGEDRFFPDGDDPGTAYVSAVRRTVYDRYVYTRRALELDYFRLIFGPAQ